MSAHGFRVGEEGHAVVLHTPQSGTAATDIFSMAEHHHVSILLAVGSVVNSAFTVTLKRSDDFSSSNTTAIDFKYYIVQSGVGNDTPGALQSSASSLTIASGQVDSLYSIEVDSQEMSEDAKNVVLDISSVNSVVSVIAVLSGSRYAEDQARSVLS